MDKQREEFEKVYGPFVGSHWNSTRYVRHPAVTDSNMTYIKTQEKWEIWQSAQAAMQPEIAQLNYELKYALSRESVLEKKLTECQAKLDAANKRYEDAFKEPVEAWRVELLKAYVINCAFVHKDKVHGHLETIDMLSHKSKGE